MTRLDSLRRRLAILLRPRAYARAIEEEMRFHLELEAMHQRQDGATDDDAAYAARRRFGNVTRFTEESRAMSGLAIFDDLRQDLRYAFRSLRRHPAFSAAALLTIAIGIGSNAAMFSVVNAVLLQPLPYQAPHRLVTTRYLMNGEYLLLAERASALQGSALVSTSGFNLSADGSAERVAGARTSANLFGVLESTPLLGRTFLPGEDRPGGDGVVVLSHALWQQRFASDSAVIGREVMIDGSPRTVIGVMQAGFRFPDAGTRLWVPAVFTTADPVALWGGVGGQLIARLAAGATAAAAQAELNAMAPAFRDANTLWQPSYDVVREVDPLHAAVTSDVRSQLLILFASVGVVLVIACVNVANLLLARSITRRREMGVRNALGGSRRRIARQLLTEAAVLGSVGGALGLLLAFAGVGLLVGSLPADTPRVAEVGIDGWVLGFTLIVTVVATLIFGLIPAWRASATSVHDALKEGGRGGSGGARTRLTAVLVAAEVAASVVLVIGAGLLIRSFYELRQVDAGIRTENILTLRLTPPAIRFGDGKPRLALYSEVLERVEALPGVVSADATSELPLTGSFRGVAFEIEGKPYVPGTSAPVFNSVRVTPGYTTTLGIDLLHGRALTAADRAGAPKVALINETMAREFWPGEVAIGKRFKEVWLQEWTTVAGVTADVRSGGLANESEPEVYRTIAQGPLEMLDMSLAIRTLRDPGALTASVRAIVADVDAAVPVSDVLTIRQVLATSVAEPRFTMLLLGGFALVALMLAAVGIYGVISHMVGSRMPEIGLRVALGGQRANVIRMVIGRALLLAGIGAAVGVVVALATTRVMRSMLFGISATDAMTVVTVPLLLLAVALLAAWAPARRAARVDPMIALRAE